MGKFIDILKEAFFGTPEQQTQAKQQAQEQEQAKKSG
jgi:hypothetical protein